MKNTYGAQIPDEDMDVMADYLFWAYGSGKGSDQANAPAASSAPGATAASASAATATTAATDKSGLAGASEKIDAQALLKANNCLACHAVDKKLVGPAYKDVDRKSTRLNSSH